MLHGKALNSTPLLLFILIIFATAHGRSYPRFSRNDSEFQHLVLHPDPSVGTVYVGARDHLFQLDGLDGLRLEQEETTGPVSDSKECLPPVTESNCPQARKTSNHNKLLLVDPKALELITCGSVHQGTCQKRSLASIKNVLFSTERPVDTQYVAANDPTVSTIGLVVGPRGGERTVMYVGRGYTASHPPISTRHLSSEPVFSYEETAKLAVAGRLSEYDHHFVTAFTRRAYVYFMFYRRDIKSVSREYRTYAARVCLDDTSYYSYVEVPLVCRSPSSTRNYNLLQAAQVGQGGGREGENLLGVFSIRSSSTNTNPLDASALCVYPLDELDKHIDSTRDLCYTKDGNVEGKGEVAYIEYEVKSSCAILPPNTLQAYPCGSDHTPSPMASRKPLEAEAVWHTSAARLTAVAVSVREGHSIAFLGDSKGTLHKVYLDQNGKVEVYANTTIQPNSPINSDLILDQNGAHIYIMTKTTVEKRPVAECGDHLDCQSCLSAKDPYCGWCVLEGRCGQRWECQRGSVKGQWLWSFNQTQQCLSIQHLSLYNISRGEKTDITVSVEGLPSLGEGEAYSCFFQDTETPASLTNTGVICSTPDATSLPPIDHGDEFVMVILSLRFLNVTVAEREFTFYNCSLVQQLSGRRPCQGCVSSPWGCNWCIHQHVCTHKHTCSQGVTIYNRNFKPPTPTIPPPTRKMTPLPPTILTFTTTTTTTTTMTTTTQTTTITTQPPPTEASTTTTTVVPSTTTALTPPTTPNAESKPPLTLATTSPFISIFTQATTIHIDVSTAGGSLSDVEGATDGDVGTTKSFSEGEKIGVDLMIETESLDITGEIPHTTLPSSTSGQVDPDLSLLEPSGDALVSSSDITSTTISEVTISTDLSNGNDKEGIPLAKSEENDSPPWLKEWEKPEGEVDLPQEKTLEPTSSEKLHVYTQSPDTVTDPNSESSANYQSDSSTDSYFLECPCVEKVQDSSLLPVNVERKITLVGQHLNLFQDEDLEYECVLDVENQSVVVDASVELDATQQSVFLITCQPHQYAYSALMEEYAAMINVRRKNNFLIDSAEDLYVTLFNCSVGRSDCSRCRTADPKYGCVWCGGVSSSRCIYQDSCRDEIKHTCPAPVIHFLDPVSGPVEGGTVVTISGSNLGQRAEDIQTSVTVAGVPCSVIHSRYEVSSRIVCETSSSGGEKSGQASVKVRGGGLGLSAQIFSFQDPVLSGIFPQRGPKAGGSSLTIRGRRLRTGHPNEVSVLIGGVPCIVLNILEDQISCLTRGSNRTGEHGITVRFGGAERHLQGLVYHYTPNPNITMAAPSKSFLSGGRIIRVSGQNLDVVQEPKMRVTLSPPDTLPPRKRRSIRRRNEGSLNRGRDHKGPLKRWRRIVPEAECPEGTLCHVKQYESRCTVNSSFLILCPTPAVGPEARRARVKVHFLLDSLHFDFSALGNEPFSYEPNPKLYLLNQNDPSKPYHHKPGSIISVEGENLDLAIYKHEVEARIGEGVCSVKTLTHNHLYCEPPSQQPSVMASNKLDGLDSLPEFTVKMGNLNFSLGRVQYDSQAQSTFPLEAQVGVGVGASIVALIVLIIVLIYRRKSKQAMRDYKKVQIQLENLETSVRDRCKKEFTDLMTEMMDMSSDLVGSGIPFLDYRAYAERIFFPGHQESPLRRDLDVPESRRQTVEQGLVQLSNLLNSKLFLTKFIHTLEVQRTFSPRDRAYVASLLTVALHGKLEYFTDILKTLLNDLVEQYVAKNPKLMLRRTESVVEKLLTNWMSICLFTFLRESAGESFYMLFRAIKHQVDKGPVDAVTGKAKYTLNDNRLLREDVEYRTLTLNVVTPNAATTGGTTTQTVPAKVLDCDTITQVKEKLLEQTWKGTSFSQRPHIDSLHLEWRAGVAGHLILSDEDLTSVVQGSWKRLNTLQHYKVPDGATVALVPRNAKHHLHDSHDYMPGEKTPMLDDGEEGGVRLWHLVKASEESELPKHRRGSVRERGGERAKAIPEIYLTRLLSMKGTLQKFVDDLFTAILSTSRPVPLAVKYFFDLLDEQALQHNINDPETIHIWKTNSLPLRFWINILKNPQFIFDVQTSDHVDAVLSVIAQTFMDSCTIADHKLGRDSPINKLLYARDIPRYKQMVERYYADIRQTISASDQEMNSALAELSRNYAAEVNCLVALHELYKYINKYYDQIITALEEDPTAQKMQLGYRLQQIAAAVENKVTDL
ncbi:plexin-B1-like [Scomber scombrus]|uniref:plexin-B1-like n=1 Tax=Scomber scombrus TaxID=13677 RepID=UPI002DD9BC75|nr:plexin-B1-like [Scomber scombrus]XP_062283827.1 plexin-B1-like [Scomber scombrus]XP_062283828.1 plexin-B1-like [Scomber scombrus]XP_062283829.1 plexin-B1-like [Scomber scombrus]XP_062283830.1 plexin-B1-like [Scomber scombrus]